jgi:hypothetical protein
MGQGAGELVFWDGQPFIGPGDLTLEKVASRILEDDRFKVRAHLLVFTPVRLVRLNDIRIYWGCQQYSISDNETVGALGWARAGQGNAYRLSIGPSETVLIYQIRFRCGFR